jgi:hypothetical protein
VAAGICSYGFNHWLKAQQLNLEELDLVTAANAAVATGNHNYLVQVLISMEARREAALAAFAAKEADNEALLAQATRLASCGLKITETDFLVAGYVSGFRRWVSDRGLEGAELPIIAEAALKEGEQGRLRRLLAGIEARATAPAQSCFLAEISDDEGEG